MELDKIESWGSILNKEFEKPYFEKLNDFVDSEFNEKKCFPPKKDIFNAFKQCPYPNLKVVIIGQDPYHGESQANGLCFSVNDQIKFPPSLRNIFKEIQNDLSIDFPESGNLERWAKQGVLLLNTVLTVEESKPGSHIGKGWEVFTDAVIKQVSKCKENIVFLLWGAYAISKSDLIDGNKHKILTSTHPSPFSAYKGFLGCEHFSKTNLYLQENGIKPINW
jgi:uracil-DNA glycosylase